MTRLVLLTGFLGAGKTTLLNHILKEYECARVGIIVNEFSGIGVDGALIRKDLPGAEMIELNNGSIFCACIKDSFVEALVEFGRRNLEYLFIEASGLADPSNIASILEQIKRLRGVEFCYLGAICLIDALSFPAYSRVLLSLRRQVEFSRAVVLNKTDLVDEAGRIRCEEAIRAICPDVPIYRTAYGKIDLGELLEEHIRITPDERESTNTADTRPITCTLITTEPVDQEELRIFLKAIAPYAYRIKGFCLTTGGAVEVSLVGEQFRMESWPAVVEQTQLAIISAVGVRIISETLKSAKECFRDKFELK